MPRTKPTLIDPDVQLLQALAHPTRLSIVRELTGTSEVCACDFTSCCDVQQPTVSHHLRILKEAGVIEAERRGLSDAMACFPDERSAVSDALTYSDLTTGPAGEPVNVAERVGEIERRYGAASLVVRALEQASESILAMVERTERRLST